MKLNQYFYVVLNLEGNYQSYSCGRKHEQPRDRHLGIVAVNTGFIVIHKVSEEHYPAFLWMVKNFISIVVVNIGDHLDLLGRICNVLPRGFTSNRFRWTLCPCVRISIFGSSYSVPTAITLTSG